MGKRKEPTTVAECTDLERAVLDALSGDGYVDIPTLARATGERLPAVSMAVRRLWRGGLAEALDYENWRRAPRPEKPDA